MTNTCEHKTYKPEQLQKLFEGETFVYMTEICQTCGAARWDNDLEKKYEAWMTDLYKGKRHLFQFQYSITSRVQDCITKLLERFPYVDESLLIRAMVSVYIDLVEDNENIMTRLDEYIQTEDYRALVVGKKNQKKIQFRPSGFNLIMSYSRLFELKPNKVIEEVLNRMILLSVKEDQIMKNFWENVILKDIGRIVNAA